MHLLTYDSAQFYIGGVESSGWVALLLGTFYAVIGSLHVAADHWQSTDSQQQTLYSKQTLPYVLASIGCVPMQQPCDHNTSNPIMGCKQHSGSAMTQNSGC